MRKPKVSDIDIVQALRENRGIRATAARQLGISVRHLIERAKLLEAKGVTGIQTTYNAPKVENSGFEFTPLPDDDIPIEELIKHRKRQFSHKAAHEEAAKLIPIKIKLDGPIGILHFGDPHVDDDGCDLEAIERHTALVNKTPGMFASSVGDVSNNWVGRLARLYAEQSTSATQAWKLAEWFVKRCQWLYMIAGNHDLWSGAGDPLRWIAKQQDSLYRASEARIALQFPNGQSVRINARHDHTGNSIWNPAHGPMKAAIMGTRDHIYVAGHKHMSAYSVLKDPTDGITMHLLRVASYKRYDRYARDHGFRDNTLSPCAVTIINPALNDNHPDFIKVFWEPEIGADYLTYLRKKK